LTSLGFGPITGFSNNVVLLPTTNTTIESKQNIGMIIGIVMGAILLVSVFTFAGVYYIRKRVKVA
jgi:hypothetical protein